MIPITSSAGWELWYMLCSRTVCPAVIVASGSPTQVDIDSTLCTSIGSSVATDLQIDWPPRLSLVASMATPWPCRCPIIATTLPGTLTFQSQWVSENPAGMEYSESPHRLPGRPDGVGDLHIHRLGGGRVVHQVDQQVPGIVVAHPIAIAGREPDRGALIPGGEEPLPGQPQPT